MAFVEQDRAAGAALRFDIESRHAVAQFGRSRQDAFALRGGGGEVDVDAGHDAALLVGRLDCHLAGSVRGRAQRSDLQIATLGDRRQQQKRRARLIGHHHLQSIEAAQPFGEACRAFVFQPVAQPDHVGAGIDLHLVEFGRRHGAIGRPGLGPEGAQGSADFIWPQRAAPGRRLIDGCRRRAHQHDGPAATLGALDQPLGVGDARRPARRRGPAVVDHQKERAATGQVGLRIEERSGHGQDQRCRQQQAQQQQPPRHLHRRLFGRLQADQQADGREAHQLGQRRDQAQQPVDHRQRQQQRKHARCREGESAEAQHDPAPSS